MSNLDDYKLDTPPEELDNTCSYCGEPCKKIFCSMECFKAEIND